MHKEEQMSIIKFMKDKGYIDTKCTARESMLSILAIRHEYGFQRGNLIQNKIFDQYEQAKKELIENEVLIEIIDKDLCYLNKEYLDVI